MNMSTPTTEKDAPGQYGIELGIGMVDIVEGHSKKLFRVHKNLLCSRAPVFDKMFKGSFLEAGHQKAELPEDSSAAFNLFFEWLYVSRIPKLVLTNGSVDPTWPYIKLYCFAEKYCLPDLADQTMSLFINNLKNTNNLPTCDQIRRGYENTAGESPMRRFMVSTLQYLVLDSSTKKNWSSEDIHELVSEVKDLGIEYFNAVRDSNGTKIADPSQCDPCKFHVHANGGLAFCPVKKFQLADKEGRS